MAEDKPCQWLCENQTFNAEETKLLHKRITQGYNVHLYVAGYSPLKPNFFYRFMCNGCVQHVWRIFGNSQKYLDSDRHVCKGVFSFLKIGTALAKYYGDNSR